MEKKDVIIIGSGPAGLTAAIYTARANLRPLVIEGFQSGGQLMITSEVENFPGFQEGITGPDLMENMKAQAEKFGTEFLPEDVTSVEFSKNKKIIHAGDKTYEAQTVIIATGASANFLGIEDESRLMGRGVSACATCDGFFYTGRDICVIGGGDSAMEEAVFLTRFASKVYLIHRRDKFRASKIMINKAESNEKIEFILDSVIEKINGTEKVEGITVKNVKTGELKDISLEGFFVAIGHTPNTSVFKDIISCDEKGYIITHTNPEAFTETSISGVFACGDVQDSKYRQAITAAGSGCMAALDAERYIEKI